MCTTYFVNMYHYCRLNVYRTCTADPRRTVDVKSLAMTMNDYEPCTTTISEEPCNGTVKFDYDSCTTTRDSSDAKFNDASSSSP